MRYLILVLVAVGVQMQELTAAPSYSITDLGVDGEAVAGVRINNVGQAVITLAQQNNAPKNRILFRNDDQLIELPTLGGQIHGIANINDKGQIVGSSQASDSRFHAVSYTNGQLQDWGTLGERGIVLTDINESGMIVGDIHDSFTTNAVIFNGPNDVTHLGTLGGSLSTAFDINNLGQITGISFTSLEYLPAPLDKPVNEAFLYEHGHMMGIGTLGGQISHGWGINDLGQIVGESSLLNHEMHAFMWDNVNGMRDLGTPGFSSLATLINNQGVIIGRVETPTDSWQAAIFDVTIGYKLLIDLIPPNSGWDRLNYATDINDLGWIVGTGIFQGQNRAFLLTPIPEPAASALLGALFLVAALCRARLGQSMQHCPQEVEGPTAVTHAASRYSHSPIAVGSSAKLSGESFVRFDHSPSSR